jgi:hypothetical protein
MHTLQGPLRLGPGERSGAAPERPGPSSDWLQSVRAPPEPRCLLQHPSSPRSATICSPQMMPPSHTRQWRSSLTLSLLCLCSGMSCARSQQERNPVVGVITPEYFRFRDVVRDDDRSAPSGGWRAVCIHAQIKHGDSEAKTICKFEVGVPIRTREDGEIPLEAAHFAAASMANRAAREVLATAHPGEMFAVLCKRFKEVYEPMLRTKIPPAKVTDCTTEGVETVPFGITPDSAPTE